MRHALIQRSLILALFVVTPLIARASKPSVATGDCDGEAPSEKVTVSKSAIFTDIQHQIRAYGQVSYRHNKADLAEKHCHVLYALFVSRSGRHYTMVKELVLNSDQGEIAGIDIVGSSPDGNQLAADFWWAQGDAVGHGPVVYDLSSEKALYRPLETRIQDRIHGCDQNEDFIGVTNDGKAIFAVPPSIYDHSPECGDKGIWDFDLKTGTVKQAAKFSGDRWH
jgi:hypothetical protein